ncbi:L-seryl-tRNA(Sec) selenium transferase [Aeromonas enteropelogenes]|uniref:L-seryl-tRNA(Sec) selenium transferase n=1 Tax=Aeromonas enteropelogenes TaxID=29489 RepID=UPI0005AA3DF8|nr:L-seryl-tRNA(Sec) selenium transferase [Aeromonas enteropelogenes]UBH57143.1 L-seryl-tRNA(Sec) selenium transferase [Aeromonas enteropelogenes]
MLDHALTHAAFDDPLPRHQQPTHRLPQVEQLLQQAFLVPHIACLSRPLVTWVVRETLNEVRQSEAFRQHGVTPAHLETLIAKRCQQQVRRRQTRVINATGTLIHTNLGRSPLSSELWDEVRDLNTGYNNLELELATGKRGGRKGLIATLLTCLTQAEDSLVVNNNAASLFLLLQEVAKGREVIVSRGEQIQIGGGFRIPDILALSGAKLVEVGTTNITTARDYLDAITDQTALVLMVHRSNFAIRGFTESPDIGELARALPDHVVLAVDQGSGLTCEEFAPDETPVRQYLKAGADLVCYSGDKLMGGPQCGIISGRADLIKRLEKHPMMRTFRPSRIIHSLLERLLIHKLNKSPLGEGIAQRTLADPAAMQVRSDRLMAALPDCFDALPAQLVVGGGTLPDEFYPAPALACRDPRPAQQLLDALRELPVPVIATVRQQKVLLNMATLLDEDMAPLIAQLTDLLTPAPRES